MKTFKAAMPNGKQLIIGLGKLLPACDYVDTEYKETFKVDGRSFVIHRPLLPPDDFHDEYRFDPINWKVSDKKTGVCVHGTFKARAEAKREVLAYLTEKLADGRFWPVMEQADKDHAHRWTHIIAEGTGVL